MNFMNLMNLKNKGLKYIYGNLLCIIIFAILYYLSDIYSLYDINDPWYYWLYFSTQ